MFHPARLKSAIVASCRLPLGMPSLSLLPIRGLRTLLAEIDGMREAAYGSLVAYEAVAFHLHAKQQRIAVAVGGCGDDAQPVAAGLTFHPQLLARAAPERNEPGLQRFFIAGWIEKPQHKHFAGARILHDAGSESIHLVEV